jgi:arylsulfatase A-like enzyme
LIVKRREFLKTMGMGAAALAMPEALSAVGRSNGRPNIIVILADDMGFSDAGCFGGEIETPNIDQLAANGLRFTQFYNCARCCPTRASLLTGQYPHTVGLARNGRSLTRNGITVAEALKEAGYNTAMAGKWHLSRTTPLRTTEAHQRWLDHRYDPEVPFAPLDTYPVHRGFDRHYGVIWGVIDHFDPFSLVDGVTPVVTLPRDYYFTDAITDKSVEHLKDFGKSEKPFFLYVAHCAPHWPLHARPEDIAKYKGVYTGGWEQLRKDRFRRQLKMGLFRRENTPLPPVQDEGMKWDRLSETGKAYQARKMAVHAAMIDRIDQSTGRILRALEKTGRLENTLIFFLSDNGASPEVPRGPGYDRSSRTRDGREMKYQNIEVEELGSETSYTGVGPPWASASNTPYRYWKQESFEGGCHTPLIVHWPKGLKASPGSITDQVGHVMDIMPTCLELGRISYPDSFHGHNLTPIEGKSLLPILQGKTREGHDRLFFEHEGGRAARIGHWKLVAYSKTKNKWELYNVAEDRTETKDLADKYPQRVRAMAEEWEEWARRVGLERP